MTPVLIQDRRPPVVIPSDRPYRNLDLFSGSASFWNQPLPNPVPLHPNSAAWVGTIMDQMHIRRDSTGPWGTEVLPDDGRHPSPAVFGGNYRVEIVEPDQPKQNVGNILILANLTGVPSFVRPFHDECMKGVPIPDNIALHRADADQERGTTIWSPSEDKLWELMGMRPVGDPYRAMEMARDGRAYEGPTPGTFEGKPFTWTCTKGAVLKNVSRNNGVFKGSGLTGDLLGSGSSATNIPYCAGLITPEEAWQVIRGQRDDFGHVLKCSASNAGAGFLSPASRGDGTMPPATWAPEGARIFLDIQDFTPYAAEIPMFQAYIKTLARYGYIPFDKTGSASLIPIFRDLNGYTTNPMPTTLDAFGASYLSLAYKRTPWHKAKVAATSLSIP